jgi:hypothetical protein
MLRSFYPIVKLMDEAGSGERAPSQCIKAQSGVMFLRSSENTQLGSHSPSQSAWIAIRLQNQPTRETTGTPRPLFRGETHVGA